MRRQMPAAVLLFLTACSQALAVTPAAAPAYKLDITMDPASHNLRVQADVTLPAPPADGVVEFLLGGNFTVESGNPAVEKVPGGVDGGAFKGINGTSAELASQKGIARYRVKLAPGSAGFKLAYQGAVDISPTSAPEEYARSFQETPGIVSTEGVYLAGSTIWYPYLGDGLVDFDLKVKSPPGWQLIAPGNGVPSSPEGYAHWNSGGPTDEISLVGGPLTLYQASAGPAEAQVYLRQPDEALAQKYLEATTRYLELYRNLIGPYPYGKFALVENFWETGYGMPSYTLLGPQIIRFPFILTSSYPHEILHNWWGNSVFVDYDTGNWCEGLTAYLADHLMKEIEGQGAGYRRDVLQKYRDFASTDRDFPLKEFRSRHSAATEAVGYGKTLMGFHALRQRMGDDKFRQALAKFYRDNRGRQASFADVRKSFEAVSGQDFGRYFDEWVNRTGAADLAVEKVAVKKTMDGYQVTGIIRQRQKGPYDLRVPVAVGTAAGTVISVVTAGGAATPFTIETKAEPTALAVDPEFDTFRLLDARETPPSVGQLFGAKEVLAVLPTNSPADTAAYRELVAAWQGPVQKITTVLDTEVKQIPADKSVWLLGRGNRLAKKVMTNDTGIGFSVDAQGITAQGKTVPFAGHSLVIVRHNPGNPTHAVAWVAGDPLAALPGLARKLPHYGKYSWLAFEGTEPANMGKGEWAAADSPLLVNLGKAGSAVAMPTLPRRQPLAELPAVFSKDKLVGHVNWLADPAREGRGFGSQGQAAAGDYIAGEFKAAGLKPAGDNGTFFQSFTANGGPDGGAHTLRNVIGYIPGTKPEFKDQAAVVSAHYDHLGFGWPDARSDAKGKLHPGADDNASGVSVLIELARNLAAGPPPERTIVFVAFSGEEAGLLGSKYYVEHPTPVPLAGIYGDVNMDTVGRLGQQPLSILASESAREWPFVFQGITAVTGIATKNVPGASESSDQRSFMNAGIPGVQLFTSATMDYHRPSDTPDKIDGDGLVKVAMVAREAVQYLASTDKRLTATIADKPAETVPAQNGERRRASVGTVPDFAFQGPGMRVEDVVPGSPAANAGIKAGDIITSLGGESLNGLTGYNDVLKKHAPGDKLEISWTRDGKPMQANIELGAR